MNQSMEAMLDLERGDDLDFAGSLRQLHTAVSGGWGSEGEWAARFAASIRAALAFAIENPAAARALTVHSRGTGAGDYDDLISEFAARLSQVTADRRRSASTDAAVVSSIVSVVGEHVRSDRIDRLDEVTPDLVYLALLPYVGFDEARRRADAAA